jgi:hypothetical protein
VLERAELFTVTRLASLCSRVLPFSTNSRGMTSIVRDETKPSVV